MTALAKLHAAIRAAHPRADLQRLFQHSMALATRELLKGFSK